MARHATDLLTQHFGKLKVLARADNSKHGAARWHVVCICGTTKTVRTDQLTEKTTVSCGCYAKELAAARLRTHGGTGSMEFVSWTSMRRRCEDSKHPAYSRYGGAGITVCKRWRTFTAFLSDMGPCPFPKGSIDRINNQRGYTPKNCRWLLKAEQSKNRSNVVWLNGMTLPDAGKKYGVKETTLRRRVKAGWPPEKLFKTPQEIGTRKH